jgi:aminoglycoside/choline kinase family phosphotransferase
MNFEYSEKFPIGYCHGDLTFSNIIVDNKNKKLAFIDFLDVKINSPIQDIIKLRQDTRYFWTLNLFDGQTDSNKIKISWAYIDSIICSNLIKNSKIEQYYSIMQLLNFFRILKYTSDDYLVNFVVDCIKDVMEEL